MMLEIRRNNGKAVSTKTWMISVFRVWVLTPVQRVNHYPEAEFLLGISYCQTWFLSALNAAHSCSLATFKVYFRCS